MGNSADALLTIINNILYFSKTQSGKLEVEPLAFDLRTAAEEEEVVELLASKAEEQGIELSATLSAKHASSGRGRPRPHSTKPDQPS